MFTKLLSAFLFVGVFMIKTSNADGNLCTDAGVILDTLSSLAQSVARIADNLAARGCLKPPSNIVDKCEQLKNGQQYYLKTSDGRFAVLNAAKQLAFIQNVDAKDAAKFTASKVGCNSYGLCIDGHCMSRCMACSSYTFDLQTVKFHLTNSDEPYSRWTFVSAGNDGEYNLKIDGSYGYLTYKKTITGDDQLTLTTKLSGESNFKFVEVPSFIENSQLKDSKRISVLTPKLFEELGFYA